MTNRIDNITIVGGGTAGWLAAIMITTFMNARRDGPPVAVTLLESPDIPTVGVGEATVPGMMQLMSQLEIDEAEFIRRSNASFKCGVRFRGWSKFADGRDRDFYHPFNSAAPIRGGLNPAYHFHKYDAPGGAHDLVDALVPTGHAIDHRRGPREKHRGNYERAIGYSYHLDAALFARYMAELAVARGVRHIQDNVTKIHLDERGFVHRLDLAAGGSHDVEFVIDCTGFRGLILGEALGEKFESWGGHLLCDRALALQTAHAEPDRLETCTTATALGAGWVWNVPLYSRIGAGYVFSSAHRTDDQAIEEFLAHLAGLGHRVTETPKVIPMRIGRRRRSWVGNCVGIGLAGGFIEPLEATAIYAIDMTVRHFIHHFPDREVSPKLAERFNRRVEELHHNILDFIQMHYVTSNRDEPFWVAAREDVTPTDTLADNLELWRHVLPGGGDLAHSGLFDKWSYLFCLYGKGFFDGSSFAAEGSVVGEDWAAYKAALAAQKRGLVEGLPDHRELVAHIRGEPAEAPAPSTRATVAVPGTEPARPVIGGLPGSGGA